MLNKCCQIVTVLQLRDSNNIFYLAVSKAVRKLCERLHNDHVLCSDSTSLLVHATVDIYHTL
jgi:hypothetical protein